MENHGTSLYSEDALIEQPAIALFAELGWTTQNCYHETYGANGTMGRENRGETVLVARLRVALASLNPALPAEALNTAIEEITRDRSAMLPARANREVYQLLKEGVKVSYRAPRGDDDEDLSATVRIIDWNNVQNNDFFLTSQL
jgi:type I restriction enzyme, R subunit